MAWYIMGGALVAALVVIAYLLGKQNTNNSNNSSNSGSRNRTTSSTSSQRTSQQPARQQQPQQTNRPVPVRQQQQPQQQRPAQRQAPTQHRKIEYAAGAALHFIDALHAEGVDRGAIYSLGDTFRVDQNFTTSRADLERALMRLGQSTPNENTALYDSIALAIEQFQKYGRQNVPWVLIVLTDGKDNASRVFSPKDHRSPAAIGLLTHECFSKARSNFFVLVGVGDVDVQALATIGQHSNSPAIPLSSFHELEQLLLNLVVQVSESIIGRQVEVGGQQYIELARVRQVNKIGIDYALVIDRSGSMDTRC